MNTLEIFVKLFQSSPFIIVDGNDILYSDTIDITGFGTDFCNKIYSLVQEYHIDNIILHGKKKYLLKMKDNLEEFSLTNYSNKISILIIE